MRDLEFDITAKDKTKPAFDQARENAKGFSSSLDDTARGYDLAGMAAKGFAAAFTVTAVQNFAQIVRNTITQAADMVDLADKVSVSVEDLQRLTWGLGLAGVAADDVDQILTQWSKRIGEAYTNGSRLADILKANGVSLTDSTGKLRSSVDLMHAYADLVARAGSDQERMTLATEAFGKAGGMMVLALRDGSDGLDRLMKAADDAGGVLDEKLTRQAADIDDAFNTMWRNFEINAKSAILHTVTFLDDLRAHMRTMDQAHNAGLAGLAIGQMAGRPAEARKGDRPQGPVDRRIAEAFSGIAEPSAEDDAMARALRDRFAPRTVFPSEKAEKPEKTKALKEEVDAYQRVMDALKNEEAMIGLNATAQRILTEQRRAGVDAASDQGKAIGAIVAKIETEKAAIEAARKQHEAFERSLEMALNTVGDTLTRIVDGSEKASTALAKLAINFAFAAAQAALFNSGPLAGLSGQTAGSNFQANTTLSQVIGYRAKGGPVDPWGTYVVGEDGPEVLKMSGASGTIMPNDEAFGGSGGRQGAAPSIHLTMQVQTPDAQSFLKSRSQVETMLARAVGRAGRSN